MTENKMNCPKGHEGDEGGETMELANSLQEIKDTVNKMYGDKIKFKPTDKTNTYEVELDINSKEIRNWILKSIENIKNKESE